MEVDRKEEARVSQRTKARNEERTKEKENSKKERDMVVEVTIFAESAVSMATGVMSALSEAR